MCMVILLSIHIPVNASDCGVLRLQTNRSIGVTVMENKCDKPLYLSIGSRIEMLERGRLWLKSNPEAVIGSAFQMICQNKTEKNLQLEFSELLTPWLSLSKLNGCSGWINNKLTCEKSNGGSNGLYCVLAYNKPDTQRPSGKIERTTSAKIRGLNLSLQPKDASPNTGNLLDALKHDVKLCKQLNQITTVIKVNWHVDTDSRAKQINIHSAGTNNHDLTECVKSVISTFQYPEFPEEVTFDLTI